MKSILFVLLAFFSNMAFATGSFYLMPTQSLDQGKTYGSLGLDVNEKLYKSFHYVSWTALGDDVIYNADKRLEWFNTRQGVSYAFKKFSLEGGYSFHYIWGIPSMALPTNGRDNGVYAKLTYKAW